MMHLFSFRVPGWRFGYQLLLALLLLGAYQALAQTGSVGIGTTAPDVSAALDIVSSSKGALLPRVADATALATPATGLLVFQTGGTPGFYYNAGTPASPSWQRLGTANGTDFIQNGTAPQAGANYNIGGSGTVGGTLTVAGTLFADVNNTNDGTFTGGSPLKGLVFGAPGTGEGIGSNRQGTVNGVGVDIYTSYVPRLSVTNAGNVGIGTSSPQQKLTVAGGIVVGAGELIRVQGAHLQWNRSGADGETWLLNQRGLGPGGIRFGASDAVSSGANTVTEWAHFDQSGNLGIGTSSPGSTLDVVGDAVLRNGQGSFAFHNFTPTPNGTILLGSLTGAGNNGPQLRFTGGGSNGTNDYLDLGQDGSGNFVLEMQDAPRLTVLGVPAGAAVGNVGIGTSAPGQKLEVAGGIKFTGAGSVLTFPDGTTQPTAATTATGADFIQNGTAPQAGSDFNVSGSGTVGGLLTAGSATVSGNLGVGTTSPVSRLSFGSTVQANVPAGRLALYEDAGLNFYGLGLVQNPAGNYGLGLWGGTSGAPYNGTTGALPHLYLDRNSGNVGLGTLAPTQKLEVAGNTVVSGNSTIGGNGSIGGNLGVGTTAPPQKLSVAGGILAATSELIRTQGAHLQWNRSGADGETWLINQRGLGTGGIRFGASDAVSSGTNTSTEWARFDGNGNLGLGTPTPGQKLEVAGGIKFTGTGSMLTFPDGSTQPTAASATNFIQNTTTPQASSNFNVSGNGTVGGTLTATNAVVTTALTGNGANLGSVVGLGVRADGGLNIGQNTTGNNVYLGYYSGTANTTGRSNVFSGTYSGTSNTTGSDNLFSGYNSGFYSTTGNANFFGGTYSGTNNTTGSNNQFIGHYSGLGNTTGGNNLFIGYQSGQYNTTGSTNTALGSNSGPASGSGNLTNATALGANVALTTSNTVVLGNNANVGIGTAAPAAKLTVQPATDADLGLRVTNGVADGTAISGNITLQTLTGSNSGFSFLGFNGGNGAGVSEVRYNTSKNRWRLGVDQRSSDEFFLDTYGTSGTSVLRVSTAGNVGLGLAPSTTYKLDVSGQVRANGVVLTSDARFKQHVRPLAGALAGVLALRGVRYEWNALGVQHGGTAGAPQVGLLAQEVEKVYPELVSTDAQGYKAVNYAQLTPVLLEALKEQQQQIETLKQEAAAAKAEASSAKAQAAQATATLDTFEARLRRLEAAGEGQARK